ncbi:hypothetical protein WAE58_14270 [Pedobacter panaciterrae]|uniref:Lipoprotein n=1 Tax=Pedobacter panaciterrae TaxID=363849 RepID=A0ABU8NN08_9SPHI
MKTLNIIASSLIIGCLLLTGCKQINKSVNETFKPSDAALKRQAQKQSTTGFTTTTTQQIQKSEMIINGDTLKANGMQEKAAVLFKDLETLQKNKTGNNSKEIQEKVNEFLKSINMSQKVNTIPTPQPKTKREKAFFTKAELERAERELIQLPQYAGKEIQIYQSVHFNGDGRIRLMLQHPENPKYVDAYEYENGKWSAPKPIQTTSGNIERRLVPLNQINFSSALTVLQAYNQKVLQVEGAKPTTHVYLSFWDGRIRWFPGTINGTRERYSIDFEPNGTLKNFKQD